MELLSPGSLKIDRSKLSNKLGEGGCGVVWRGTALMLRKWGVARVVVDVCVCVEGVCCVLCVVCCVCFYDCVCERHRECFARAWRRRRRQALADYRLVSQFAGENVRYRLSHGGARGALSLGICPLPPLPPPIA